jgi:hypothetical protein
MDVVPAPPPVTLLAPCRQTALAARRSAPGASHWLAAAFGLYGLVAIPLLAILVPPFQNPDEVAHFLRAAGLADGRVVLSRLTTTWPDGRRITGAGGPSDPGIVRSFLPFAPLPFHPDQRAAAAMWAPKVAWSVARTWEDHSGAAVYPPPFYLPAAAGVLVGRLARMGVTQTLVLSRLLTGLAAVALGTTAIALGGSASVVLFAILTVPMALSLMASAAQDGVMLATAALAGELILRLRRGAGPTPAACTALAVTLGLLGMARPPYLGLVLGLAGLRLVSRAGRAWAAGAVCAATLGWVAIAAIFTAPDLGALVGADPSAQLAYLAHHPLALPMIARRTLTTYGADYLEQFIGRLGWLDTALPAGYHRAALIVLGLAGVAACIGPRPAARPAGAAWLAAGLGVSVAGVFALQYLTWTSPGHAVVEGVQGRYFLPLALVGAAGLPALGTPHLAWPRRALVAAVVLFAPVTLAVTMQAVIARYYLG